MKIKLLVIVIVIAVFVQCVSFTQTGTSVLQRRADRILGQANTLQEKEKYNEAIALLLKNKELFTKAGDFHYALAATKLGSLYQAIDDYVKAEPYYLESKDIYEKELDKDPLYAIFYAVSLGYLGLLYYNMGDYSKAEPYLLATRAINDNAWGKDDAVYAESSTYLGVLYRTMGDYTKAKRYLLEAKTIYEKALGKNDPDYAGSLNNLGELYRDMGDYAKAEAHYLEAKTIFERSFVKNHPIYAGSLNNLGELYQNMGDYAKAELYLLDATAIYKKAFGENHPDYAMSLNSLGNLYNNMRDYTKAKPYYQKAKNIYEKTLGKNHPNYASSLNNLGELYQDTEDYAKAEACYLEAKTIFERSLREGHPVYAKSLNNLGELYQNKGNYSRAEAYYLDVKTIFEQSLGKNHPDYAYLLSNMDTLYQNIGDYAKAEACNKELSELRINLIVQNFSFMSEQQRALYLETVSRDFESSYSLSRLHPVETLNELNYTNTLFFKGLLLRTTKAVREAIYKSGDTYQIGKFEELGKLRQQISASLQKENPNEAYIRSLEAEAEKLDKDLTRDSAAFRNLKEDIAMQWQTVRDSLQPGEAAIEFVSFRVYDKKWTDTIQYAALVLRPGMDAPAWVPLCEKTKLKDILNEVEDKGYNDDYKNKLIYDTNGDKLYSLVWQPLEQELKDVTTIYYSPSGLLHKIAFGALPTGDDEEIDFENFNFDEFEDKGVNRLADKYDLNLVSSTREVVYLPRGQTEAAISSAVLYGNLDYENNEGETVSRLPKRIIKEIGWHGPLLPTKEEALTVQGYLNRKNVPNTLYLGIEGNEESFKALNGEKKGLIYLATHGFFRADPERRHSEQEQTQRGAALKPTENPLLRSGLLLAGGNKPWKNINNALTNNQTEWVESGGILTADMIAGMNLLGAKLVVLSACETGLGDVNNQEGVFGLQRSFKLAGVETLIMSLWKADAESSAKLMSVFLQEWLFSGKSRQAAFKEAQRQVRAEHPEPYHWAVFVMLD